MLVLEWPVLKAYLTSVKNAEVMIVLKVDSTKCTSEGPETNVAEVGKSAQVTVHTVYQNGQLYEEKQMVEPELKSVVNDLFIPKLLQMGEKFMRARTLQRFVGGTPWLLG